MTARSENGLLQTVSREMEYLGPALDNMTPVNPPKLNENINPMLNNIGVLRPNEPDHSVLNQLNILEQVGIAITDVVAVNYALVSISNPTVYI